MKVQISIKVEPNPSAHCTLELVVPISDTVADIKKRVASSQSIPFPIQDIVLDGEVLDDKLQAADCGIKDLSSLDLVVKASSMSLVQQLSELLQTRDLSCDELSLLYCYKFGTSVAQALKMLGYDMTLKDFIKTQKEFQLENNIVTLLHQGTSLKPFSVVAEVEQILREGNNAPMDIKEVCAKFAQKFSMSLSSVVSMKPCDFFTKESDVFAFTGRIVSLKTQRQALAEHASPQPAENGGNENAVPHEHSATPLADSQQYLDLHARICTRTSNTKVSRALSEAVELISKASFLNVDHIVKGGSVGKGTVISESADAEVVLFLHGLPKNGHERWMPPLLAAVAGTLRESLGREGSAEGIDVIENTLQLRVGSLCLRIHLSPSYGSYTKAIRAMASQVPVVRELYAPALMEERVLFVSRQPESVKITIRLLKWWRDQRDWSGSLARPTDDILELLSVYSAVQTRPSNQRMAIANVMSLLCRFDELRVVWSNYYSKDDVWAPLLQQRPLLMDPVNPFVNIADPKIFHPRELMSVAKTTHFFW
mmetsp:Transcript_46646/g.107770  ORF Transcript_46646/g.107770 Transcript_46646/m.107770 type:complete len:539 (+) Transcript_46646:133-1749(+)|eukprot:CAMPEP_0171109872 /NCGR_PEP_ID=MMETSP0766_2-20121228/71027_1 /TAXON_ID=439317 /ORGANISM="Gambierdiscus australes, Strain CAWD 149" /LENGTH=538 /DNA_ID=CAMNT_0011571677 /DNA_START=126 /DNA_END=1742 /DNA_ORIENTATION=-